MSTTSPDQDQKRAEGEPPPLELDAALAGLDERDALVRQARETLEETLAGLKLTPAEELALSGELGRLRDLAQARRQHR